MLFWPILGQFWCPVVTVVTFSNNLSNFKKNTKSPKKIWHNFFLIKPRKSKIFQYWSEKKEKEKSKIVKNGQKIKNLKKSEKH